MTGAGWQRIVGWRCLAVIVAAAALLAWTPAPLAAQDTGDTVGLIAGGSTTIALPGNPTTGYSWRLNRAASTNLGVVRIADGGFVRPVGGPPIGAPGEQRFSITAQRPGSAVAVFEYLRPWERGIPPARTRRVRIDVVLR